MDISIAVVNAVVVTIAGIVLGWFGRGQFRALKDEIVAVETRLGDRIDAVAAQSEAHTDGVENRLTGRIEGLDTSLGARIDRLEGRMDRSLEALRSDVIRVALAVGAEPRAENA